MQLYYCSLRSFDTLCGLEIYHWSTQYHDQSTLFKAIEHFKMIGTIFIRCPYSSGSVIRFQKVDYILIMTELISCMRLDTEGILGLIFLVCGIKMMVQFRQGEVKGSAD